MKTRPHFPLLAKVLVWLLLNLTIVALAFLGFMIWQLGLGLDSLLSGAAGDRLRAFGESARAEVAGLPRDEWNQAIKPLADEKHVLAGFHDRENGMDFPAVIPPNVLEKIRSGAPPRMGPPERRGPLPPGVDADRPVGFDPKGRPDDRGLPPFERSRNRPQNAPPASRPVFLVRGKGGDGYWAGVEVALPRPPGQPQRPALLLIRSDRMDGSGMFFEVKPWLLGAFGVLALSLLFWAPFVWGITRYINRLRMATDQIAAGRFQVSLPTRGNDELGNLGEALKTMSARLDHLVTGQKRFMGDAAHELCAPLARLRTGMGILEMALPENQRQRLAQIEDDAHELASLVEEILAFSRAENRPPSRLPIAVEEIAREVLARESPGYEVELKIPEGLKVLGDHGLLARALGNLVRNAEVHAGKSARVVIQAEEKGKFVDIRVTDDGPGVAGEELSRLFEPFYRPDRSRSRLTGGSGLGLSIVRSAVEACGGEVSAFIPQGGGFGVVLKVPRA